MKQDGGDPSHIDWKTDFVQVVSGGLLGDGYMSLLGRTVTPIYTETHGFRQRDYLLWKCNVLGGSYSDSVVFDKRTGRFYPRTQMWFTDTRNRDIYSLFYPRGKKTITNEALCHVGELGLTILWLDDGSTKLHDGNGKLSLQSFSDKENKLIMQWLNRQFGIGSVLTLENEIFFDSKEMPKLLSCVYPVFKTHQLPACMAYKMGFIDPRNATLIEDAKEARRTRDRERLRKLMLDPVKRTLLHERVNKARKRRIQNPEYRLKYNQYHKEYERKRRAKLAKK